MVRRAPLGGTLGARGGQGQLSQESPAQPPARANPGGVTARAAAGGRSDLPSTPSFIGFSDEKVGLPGSLTFFFSVRTDTVCCQRPMTAEQLRAIAEKAAEQTRIALEYQRSVNARNARRQKADGVVVTPVGIVDFQIRSALEQVAAMGREPDDSIEWLDPCGGTGIYTARLLQLVDLPPHRKRAMADNCAVIEIDAFAAQMAANNLGAVYLEETGVRGAVRVICADTFALPPDVDLWGDDLPLVLPEVRRG